VTKRGLLIASAVAAAIMIAMVFANAHIRSHRKVYFVNGLPEIENMMIDGRDKVTLRPNRWQELVLAEGTHTAAVTSPIKKTVSFEIKSRSYFSRWFDSPVWIINPDASACLLYQEVTYSQNPTPPRERILFGRESYSLAEVSHPFISLPDSVKVSSKSEERTLQHVEAVTQPLEAFYYLRDNGQVTEAIQLAEIRLGRDAGDEELLHAYLQELKTQTLAERGRKFLESGVAARPVRIGWHRAYQDLSRRGQKSELLALYESFLKNEPTNSTLLYLRGRIENNPAISSEFYRKAIEIDPQNAFAYYALAYKSWNAGDWMTAKPLLARATELRPEDASFWKTYNVSRMATGDFDMLEKDLRDRLVKNPLDFLSAVQLLEVFAAKLRTADAEMLIATTIARGKKSESGNAAALDTFLRSHFLYASGQFAELEKLSARDRTSAGPPRLRTALVEQGKVAEAAEVQPAEEDPLRLLSFSLAFRLAGNAEKAKEFLDLARKGLEESPSDFKIAGELLASAQAPADDEIAALSMMPQSKALIAAVLRLQHPAQADRFKRMARNLNVERVYPYHLIQRSLAVE
jgi:hypothetical protein